MHPSVLLPQASYCLSALNTSHLQFCKNFLRAGRRVVATPCHLVRRIESHLLLCLLSAPSHFSLHPIQRFASIAGHPPQSSTRASFTRTLQSDSKTPPMPQPAISAELFGPQERPSLLAAPLQSSATRFAARVPCTAPVLAKYRYANLRLFAHVSSLYIFQLHPNNLRASPKHTRSRLAARAPSIGPFLDPSRLVPAFPHVFKLPRNAQL